MKGWAIVNPAAGGGRCGKKATAALDALRDRGLTFEVKETTGPGDAGRIAAEAVRQGITELVAVGGDGTSYEIINGALPAASEQGTRVTLGLLPLGTGNSFMRDFTDDGANYAIEALVQRKSRPVDVIRFEHEGGELLYMNILSMGFVADVTATTNRKFKRLGELGYVVGVVRETVGLAPSVMPFAVDGAAFDDKPVTFLSFNNSKFTGGKMMMAPAADSADGRLDVVRVGAMGRGTLLATFPRIFKGTHVDHPDISAWSGTTVAFAINRPVDLMIDGEVETHVPRRLEVMPAALDVRV